MMAHRIDPATGPLEGIGGQANPLGLLGMKCLPIHGNTGQPQASQGVEHKAVGILRILRVGLGLQGKTGTGLGAILAHQCCERSARTTFQKHHIGIIKQLINALTEPHRIAQVVHPIIRG